MDAGKRNCLVVIQTRAAGQDDNGEPNGAWSTFASRWANIRHGTGTEAIRGGAVSASTQVSISLGYCRDVTTAMRVTHLGVTYEVLAVLPDLAKRDRTDLVCRVIV
jgi:SPP1 family predicted phage head-tail adaptor